jgi:glutathione peroxidase-family protein
LAVAGIATRIGRQTAVVPHGNVGCMTAAPIHDIPLTTLDGDPISLSQFADRAVLVVNVASKCGLTPQYSALQKLAADYGDRGLTVIGVPCNQFMGQEPGSAEEIRTFCATTYGVTFPLLEKAEVNGEERHRCTPSSRRHQMATEPPATSSGTSRSSSSPLADGSSTDFGRAPSRMRRR